MNVFDNVIQIFPKVLFFMIAPSAGNFLGKRFLAHLSEVILQFFVIFSLLMSEGSQKLSTLIALLSMEL